MQAPNTRGAARPQRRGGHAPEAAALTTFMGVPFTLPISPRCLITALTHIQTKSLLAPGSAFLIADHLLFLALPGADLRARRRRCNETQARGRSAPASGAYLFPTSPRPLPPDTRAAALSPPTPAGGGPAEESERQVPSRKHAQHATPRPEHSTRTGFTNTSPRASGRHFFYSGNASSYRFQLLPGQHDQEHSR